MSVASSYRFSSEPASSKFVSDSTMPLSIGATDSIPLARCSAPASVDSSSNRDWVRGGSSSSRRVSPPETAEERSATGSGFGALGAVPGVRAEFPVTTSLSLPVSSRFGTSVAFSSKVLMSTSGASSKRSEAVPACAASRIRSSSGSSEEVLSDESLMKKSTDSRSLIQNTRNGGGQQTPRWTGV